MTIRTDGPVFHGFKRVLAEVRREPLSIDTETCSRKLVEQLLATGTTSERPGMLLGRIQSGKTRAFVGAIAIAFDNDFDIAVVLTKNSVALTKQTVSRLRADLSDSVRPRDVIIEDIYHLGELIEWEQSRKLVFVCKKHTKNLQKLREVMLQTYPQFAQRRVLLIDDEADNASIGYQRRNGILDLRVIPQHIDDLRTGLGNRGYYLQVTATPQALYLQPVNIELPGNGRRVRQLRPLFTLTVPVHSGYIGGYHYFERSREPGTTESYLHSPIPTSELDALKQEDRTIFNIEDVLTTPEVAALRRAIVTFLVGGCIRQLQQADAGQPAQLYSFIVHTETKKVSHRWQERVTRELITRLQQAAAADIEQVRQLVVDAQADLDASLTAEGLRVPSLDRVLGVFRAALDSINVRPVNTDSDMVALLDDSGQLNLRTPYNVFIGGQILDRGLTIDNLIGFYYGRAPQRAQEDTTLQHCRMYGKRPRADLAVTRFYTTPGIYQRMLGIHERDEALWQSIERNEQDPDRIFMHADATGDTRPCGLAKILSSRVATLREGKELLPVGFSTVQSTRVQTMRDRLDTLIQAHEGNQQNVPFEISVDVAVNMIDLARQTVRMDAGEVFDWNAMKAAVRYLAQQHPNPARRDRAVCLVRRGATGQGMNYNKFRMDRNVQRLQNEPHGRNDPNAVRRVAGPSPGIILLKQNGLVEDNWSGDSFYWPVLIIPNGIEPRIFSEENS